jgi:hypothetical protein
MRWRQSFDNCLETFDGPNRMGSSYYVRQSARLAGLVGKLWLSQYEPCLGFDAIALLTALSTSN